MSHGNYIPVETGVLRELYEEGLTLKQIGERFGMTKQAVQLRLIKAGVPRRLGCPRPLPNPDPKVVESMYFNEEISLVRISERVGASIQKVRRVARELGLNRSRHHLKKYPELDGLQVGESVIYPRSSKPSANMQRFHNVAKRRGIKLSVRPLDDATLKVTRKA